MKHAKAIVPTLRLPSAKFAQTVAPRVLDLGAAQFVVPAIRVGAVIVQQAHDDVPANGLIAAPQNRRRLARADQVQAFVACRLFGLCGMYGFVDFGHYSALIVWLAAKLFWRSAMKEENLILLSAYLLMIAKPGTNFDNALMEYEMNLQKVRERNPELIVESCSEEEDK